MSTPKRESPTASPVPPRGSMWAPGAEPMAICMSCNSTFPPHFLECTQCQVALSVIRKCPSCGKVQSANHVTCIYCADSFLQEDGLMPTGPGPLARRVLRAERRLRIIAVAVIALLVVGGGGLAVKWLISAKTYPILGQSYVLEPLSMRTKAAPDAPPVKDLAQGDMVSISDYSHDLVGNRWFRITSGGISGYVPAESLAPPKSNDPEKGYEILRHSLMTLDNPEVVALATQAVDLYHTSHPASSHYEELRWLLAERTRQISQSRRSAAMGETARKIFEEIAKGSGEFSGRAREALEELPAPSRSSPPRSTRRESSDTSWRAVGGSGAGAAGYRVDPSAPIRRVTVVSRTPLYVRLTQPGKVSAGAVFQGEFANDVRVSSEVAVPQGSSAVVTVAQQGSVKKVENLLLTGATIRGESYMISGYSRGVDVPGSGRLSASKNLPSNLPAGTTIEFQLNSDLIVRQR